MRVHVDKDHKIVPHDRGCFYQCDGAGFNGAGCNALVLWNHLITEKWQSFSYKSDDLHPGAMTKLFGGGNNPSAHLCPWCAHAFTKSLKPAPLPRSQAHEARLAALRAKLRASRALRDRGGERA